MTNLMKFNAADLDQLMDKITRNSIGIDEYLNNVFHTQTQSNYPPYNVVQLNNIIRGIVALCLGMEDVV